LRSLRTLLVTFANDIGHTPISAFRGAVIEKVGRENLLFHHHLGEDQFLYKYPLIQYKKIGRQPGIFCMDEGVDELHKLFEQRNWTIDLQGNPTTLKVDRIDLKDTRLNIWDKKLEYNLWNWQALNEDNWKRYQSLESMVEKIAFLEKILIGNILSFAKGIGWLIDKPVVLVIRDVKLERNSRMKDIKVRTFEVDFRCNVELPDFMGLGKGVSKGFGVLRHKNLQ